MDISWFKELKRDLNGQLSAPVYHRLFELARATSLGILVDIGAAQGASSAAIAAGLMRSGHPGPLFCVDRCYGSKALASKFREDTAANHKLLEDNLARYGAADMTRVLSGTISEVAWRIPSDAPITLLCIDADGNIDRDMMLLYSRLCSGAAVIFDDCRDIVNTHGQKFLNATLSELEAYVESSRNSGKWGPGDTLADHTPLGKDYSIFRFVQQLEASGCLERTEVIGGVWFGRKPAAPGELDVEGLRQVRNAVYRQFLELRETR